jgi:hypothetical protein
VVGDQHLVRGVQLLDDILTDVIADPRIPVRAAHSADRPGAFAVSSRAVACAAGTGQALLRLPGAPWHILYLRPEPQGQGALRPTLAFLPLPAASVWRSTSPPPSADGAL